MPSKTATPNSQTATTTAKKQRTNNSAVLRSGLDRLTKVLEKKVDQQILSAQIRAYNAPVVSASAV